MSECVCACRVHIAGLWASEHVNSGRGPACVSGVFVYLFASVNSRLSETPHVTVCVCLSLWGLWGHLYVNICVSTCA